MWGFGLVVVTLGLSFARQRSLRLVRRARFLLIVLVVRKGPVDLLYERLQARRARRVCPEPKSEQVATVPMKTSATAVEA